MDNWCTLPGSKEVPVAVKLSKERPVGWVMGRVDWGIIQMRIKEDGDTEDANKKDDDKKMIK